MMLCVLSALPVIISDACPQRSSNPARGHMGGLLGGALTAYLLGPHLKVVKGPKARQRLIDSPPVPIFASKL